MERTLSDFEGTAAWTPKKSEPVSRIGKTWTLDSKEAAKLEWCGGDRNPIGE
jgi:hypothetical protein